MYIFIDAIVTGFTWHHHGICPLLWYVFSIQLCRCLWCFCQCFFYMCCRVIIIYILLCYCYFCSQFSIIFHVNYGCSETTNFLVRSFIHNIWYHSMMGEWGVTRISKKRYLFHRLRSTVQYTWTPYRSFWWLVYYCVYIFQNVKNLVEGFLSWYILSDQLIYTNWLLQPLIIRFNEILLEFNHVLFHRFDMIQDVGNYICHILCFRFVRYINVVRVM